MSTTEQMPYVIAPHRFAVGFTRQTFWNWRIGAAFFFGEIGAGLFLVSLVMGQPLAMLVGYLIVVAGKNTAHLLYLGRPSRFWRAAMRPDRSWIARGIWATGLFAVSGFILLAPQLLGFELGISASGQALVQLIAGASALFIMFYDGLVMKASPAIPFWNSGALPALCLTYATLGGVTLSLMITALTGGAPLPSVERLEHWLLVVNACLLAIYVLRMSRLEPAARQTVQLLLRGRYRRAFLGLVVLVGLAATLLLSLVKNPAGRTAFPVVIAACELVGDFTLLMVLLKAGLYSPQMTPKSG